MTRHRPPGKRSKPARSDRSPASAERLDSTRLRRNVWVSGRRTSVSLEIAVWDALAEICGREEQAMDGLCSLVDARRQRTSLASSLRVFVLAYFRGIADRLSRRPRRQRETAAEPSVLAVALARLPRRRARPGRRAEEG